MGFRSGVRVRGQGFRLGFRVRVSAQSPPMVINDSTVVHRTGRSMMVP